MKIITSKKLREQQVVSVKRARSNPTKRRTDQEEKEKKGRKSKRPLKGQIFSKSPFSED